MTSDKTGFNVTLTDDEYHALMLIYIKGASGLSVNEELSLTCAVEAIADRYEFARYQSERKKTEPKTDNVIRVPRWEANN